MLATAAAFAGGPAMAETPRSPNLGAAPTGFGLHRRVEPVDLVDLAHNLGLGVVETRLTSNEPDAVKALRQKVEGFGMRVILDTPLPRAENDVERFDAAVAACKNAGAISLHAAMTQRRYEEFDTFEAFKARFEACQKQVMLAEPILRKHRVKLGIENHKGWRSAEQAAWMKRLASEWVGVHFDFGNNISLCEDPEDTFTNLAPYAVAAHIKDMAVQPYDDGFLLSEVPLGEGLIDLPKWVNTLRAKDRNFPFDLETITRDPLKIPIFTKKYWATFDDSYSPLPGRELAKTFVLVKTHPPKSPLPRTTGLSPADQAKLEDDNNRKSIEYARARLGL
jgi:sugar phosphate isomerase/epimerase